MVSFAISVLLCLVGVLGVLQAAFGLLALQNRVKLWHFIEKTMEWVQLVCSDQMALSALTVFPVTLWVLGALLVTGVLQIMTGYWGLRVVVRTYDWIEGRSAFPVKWMASLCSRLC